MLCEVGAVHFWSFLLTCHWATQTVNKSKFKQTKAVVLLMWKYRQNADRNVPSLCIFHQKTSGLLSVIFFKLMYLCKVIKSLKGTSWFNLPALTQGVPSCCFFYAILGKVTHYRIAFKTPVPWQKIIVILHSWCQMFHRGKWESNSSLHRNLSHSQWPRANNSQITHPKA